jgi:hypothetical protein
MPPCAPMNRAFSPVSFAERCSLAVGQGWDGSRRWRFGKTGEKCGGFWTSRRDTKGQRRAPIPAWGSAPQNALQFGTAPTARLIIGCHEFVAHEFGRCPRLGWIAPLALWEDGGRNWRFLDIAPRYQGPKARHNPSVGQRPTERVAIRDSANGAAHHRVS